MKPKNAKIEMLNNYYNFVLEMIKTHKLFLTFQNNELTPTEKEYLENLEVTKNITNDLLKSLHEFNNLDIDKESLWKSLLKTQTKQEKN
jgi:hypothetical protein